MSSLAVYRESLRAKKIKRSVQLLQGVRLNMKGKNKFRLYLGQLKGNKEGFIQHTSYSFIKVPFGFFLVTGTQGLAIWCMEETVIIEGRFPGTGRERQYKAVYIHIFLCKRCPKLTVL